MIRAPRGRVRVSGFRREPLAREWELASTAPDLIAGPAELESKQLVWHLTSVPITVAAELQGARFWTWDSIGPRLDAEDWWFRCEFDPPDARKGDAVVLGFDGLATVADVWLNSQPILSSENMFVAHEVRVEELLQADNVLVIRFKSVSKLLAAKRPRPRWRVPMIENQQLRWFRTTLLGNTPGWSPPAPAIGPWRPVWLEVRPDLELLDTDLACHVRDGQGVVDFATQIELAPGIGISSAVLDIERDGKHHKTPINFIATPKQLRGSVTVPNPELWWPHTHGTPALYQARLLLTLTGAQDNARVVTLGAVGFRTVDVQTADGDFQVRVNEVPVFCRGACWTPDALRLSSTRAQHAQMLERARNAGMNMIRVGGTMVYESDDFLDLCDELGILVWQDLMFANMDYPEEDPRFLASTETELTQQFAKFKAHPSVAVICGNSEVEQQAAMWGASRERWAPKFFHQHIPELMRKLGVDLPYWPSSAHGGAFPHQPNQGTSSYYGVGAYMRPLEDARHSGVRFASECLAFANVPEESSLARMPGGLALRPHHPKFKARTPRDLGAGWDFDDVRDFYVARLFGIDPMQLRYADADRYLALGRIATAEVMAATFSEWRGSRSQCRGGLVWFLRDLWDGCGWGICDALGAPKAPYYYLRRALQPRAVSIRDEGVSGIELDLINETDSACQGILELHLYRDCEHLVRTAQRPVEMTARSITAMSALDWFEGFLDLSYAYRFGPPSHDVLTATLKDAGGALVSRAVHLPLGLGKLERGDLGLSAKIEMHGSEPRLTIRARRYAHAVTVALQGGEVDEQYFHLPPETPMSLPVRNAGAKLSGSVTALNSSKSVTIETAP